MPSADPSLSLAQRIDSLCDRFEADWKAGRRADVDAYLQDVPAAEQDAVRSALLAVRKELETHNRSVDSSVSQDSDRTGAYQPSRSIPERIGRFEIVALLGEGAFGRVYKARDPQLDRDVAIKVPKLEAFAGRFDLQRFLREAKSAAAIQHPNICPVHEVNVEGDQPYIVMAFIPGKSLAENLKSRSQPLPPKQAALIVRKLALALQAAHDKGIVHRDLKPANVLFDPQRKDVVITDFGLAVRTTGGDVRETRSGMLLGTPAYMSPEQARGDVKQVGPASDLFALGVILYELLTNQRPFLGSLGEVIGQIQHVEPPSIRTLNPQLDERLDAICRQAMAKNPADRFPSMKALAAALDAYLRDQPTAVTTTQKAKEADPEQSVGMAQVLAALSADRRAETEAAVESAVRRVKPPTKLFVLIGLLIVGSITALGGIIFFTRTPTATVMINIDVDLNDKTLSFFLDGKQVPAESLQAPIELKVGTHELIVKRGEEVIRKFTFTVSRDAGPRIELRDESPPKKENAPTKPVWKPLIKSADELIEGVTRSRNTETCSVHFENESLTLTGAGAKFFPKFTAKNYLVRARVLSLRESLVFTVRRNEGGSSGYHGVFHNVEFGRDWSTCGIGEGENIVWWGGLAGSWHRVVNQFPAELAISVFEDQIALYVNGEKVCEAKTTSVTPGGVMIGSKLNYAASLRDLSVCVLDGTRFTPDDVYPQRIDDETKRLLSPEFLTDELKKNNLLLNPGFEDGEQNWRSHSGGKKRTTIVNAPVHSGKQALRISSDWWDAARAIQIVAVKPNRRYLLSGWIKTENVRFYERDKSGAHLFVPGGYRHRSANVPATSDWIYYAVVIHSGDRTEIKVQPALGHFGGTVMGTAWFDDLCLIELPDNNAAQDDLARWQGTWRCVAEHSRGKRVTDDELKQRARLMVIDGNKYRVERTLDGKVGVYSGTFRLDPAKTPKHFDFDGTGPAGAQIQLSGMYEFDGMKLRFIYRHQTQGSEIQRASWKDIGQANVVWFEFERVPEDPDRTAAEWIIRIGAKGEIYIPTTGNVVKINENVRLPEEPFRLTKVDFERATKVTDEAASRFLKGLQHVEHLRVDFDTNPGHRSLAFLKNWDRVKEVWLNLNALKSEETLATLVKECPNIERLTIVGYRQAGGIAQLKNLRNLNTLWFIYCTLDDKDFDLLVAHESMKVLFFGSCGKLKGKVEEMKKMNPRLDVLTDQ